MKTKLVRKFYLCGVCSSYHALEWDGDCRDDLNRFHPEQLDDAHGYDGWVEVPMPGGEEEEQS